MVGEKGSFEPTRWTEIQRANTRDQERREVSINNLIRRYWKPVYCYLRHKGYSNEDAKDLTQDFFHEIVLGRELIQQADRTKGRFRTFLLTALDRFVTSVYRKETAKKRLPERGLVQLDDMAIPDLPVAESEKTPELAFHYAWATNLLDQIFAMVKKEFYTNGNAKHWEVFYAIVVAPIRENTEIPSLTELCEKYGIETEKKASNMITTVKRAFIRVRKHHIRKFVCSDSEVEDEIRALNEILSKSGAA